MSHLLDEILPILKQRQGIDFSGYRRSTLERRVAVRMAKLGIIPPKAYLQRLQTDPSECEHLANAIGLNVSSFFRDPLVFELLAQNVIPELIDFKKKQNSRELRIWSAGCAAGEEAYSLAILLHRALARESDDWTINLFATDINSETLQLARNGIYARDAFETTQVGILDAYFTPHGNRYEVKPFLRKMVQFSLDDLTSPDRIAPAESIFGGFDLIMCRNVLIYFTRELHQKVLQKLYLSLVPKGYLIIGPSESLGASEQRFRAIDRRNRIWRKAV